MEHLRAAVMVHIVSVFIGVALVHIMVEWLSGFELQTKMPRPFAASVNELPVS